MSAFVEVSGLEKGFRLSGELMDRITGREPRLLRAVSGINLDIARGETLGLIGESGCGKSTLGRLLVGLHAPSAGQVRFDGHDLAKINDPSQRALRRRVQLVFQDPYASLNPRRSVRQILEWPLHLHGVPRSEWAQRVQVTADQVGIARAWLERFPHQFSGGQRQRIGIARALILRPDFVVCDEPVSALDLSVQAQILKLLKELRDDLGLTMLFISHDLAVVATLSHRVAVMYLGRIIELGTRDQVVRSPKHPYTRALLASVPRLTGAEPVLADQGEIKGDLPSPLRPPKGCAFHTRCPMAGPRCTRERPLLASEAALAAGSGQLAADRAMALVNQAAANMSGAAPATVGQGAAQDVACHLYTGGTE